MSVGESVWNGSSAGSAEFEGMPNGLSCGVSGRTRFVTVVRTLCDCREMQGVVFGRLETLASPTHERFNMDGMVPKGRRPSSQQRACLLPSFRESDCRATAKE